MGEIIVEKSKNENSVDKKIKKKKCYKMVIRRLPINMTQEYLLECLGPLPSNERFWFRNAETWLEDDAFPYAFIIFDDFEHAAKFQRKFHGQILKDSDGNENTIIVEKAANQDYYKNPSIIKEKNIKSITEDVGYIKFVEENQNNISHQKIDFDVLVNEIVEKEKKLSKGNYQETPLTDYFAKKQHEKTIRSKITKNKISGKSEKEYVSKKFEGKEKPEKESKSKFRGKFNNFETKNETKIEKDAEEESTTIKPKTFERKKESHPPKKPKSEEKKDKFDPKTKFERKTFLKNEATSSGTKSEKTPIKTEEKPPTSSSTKQKEDKNDKISEKKEESLTKKSIGAHQKNKDRPERAIYQPGRGKKFYGGSKPKNTETETSSSSKQ